MQREWRKCLSGSQKKEIRSCGMPKGETVGLTLRYLRAAFPAGPAGLFSELVGGFELHGLAGCDSDFLFCLRIDACAFRLLHN